MTEEIEIGGWTTFGGDTFAVELKRDGEVIGVVPRDILEILDSAAGMECEIEETKTEKETAEEETETLKTQQDKALDLVDVAAKFVDGQLESGEDGDPWAEMRTLIADIREELG